jgi:hypothetical protein
MIGAMLSIRLPKEYLNMSPGYYMAIGDNAFPQEDSDGITRIYWNLTAPGAISLIHHATSMLNRAGVPYRLKVINDPSLYIRCDAGVLYVPRNHYMTAREIIEHVYNKIADDLKSGIPAFTKPLARGIGLAEDPGKGESFGLNRCGILAEGIIRAYEQGCRSLARRLRVVQDCFTESRVSLNTPFLNAGSADIYGGEFLIQHGSKRRKYGDKLYSTEYNGNSLLLTAVELGAQLVQEALWYEDRCNWLGGVSSDHHILKSHSGTVYSMCGPDLYAGTSGIALFLAELYAATSASEFRCTALGAIQHTLNHINSVPNEDRLGLYSGWPGIAFALGRVGSLLNAPNLLENARELAEKSVCELQDEQAIDVMSGVSGAIIAFIALKEILDDASLLETARDLGDSLFTHLDQAEAGDLPKSRNLQHKAGIDGYLKGLSGIGHAFIELFHTTRDLKYGKEAIEAFRYNKHLSDLKRINQPGSHRWGMALSRLRAYEVLKDEQFAEEALSSLDNIRNSVDAVLQSGHGDFSLAQGLAGNANTLLFGKKILGNEFEQGNDIAMKVACYGINLYASRNIQWPCATISGESPSLMLGLAGIGHFFLSIHNPKTPSVLLLTPEPFQPDVENV